jgi:hypothetical protein
VQAAAAHAALHGVLVNDPARGVRTLSDTADRLLLGDNVTFVAKAIDVNGFTQRLADRAPSSQSVWVQGGFLKGDVERVRQLGLEVNKLPTTLRQHGNVLVADTDRGRQMLVTTASPISRGLAMSPDAQPTRELGVLIDDQRVIDDVLASIEQMHGQPVRH